MSDASIKLLALAGLATVAGYLLGVLLRWWLDR